MSQNEPGKFSLRYGLRPRPTGLLYDSVPETARVGLTHIVDECEPFLRNTALYKEVTWALHARREPSACDYPGVALDHVKEILRKCDWWAFFDVCEVIAHHFRPGSVGDEFEALANQLFDEEQVGWRLNHGLVERVGTEQSQRLIDDARRSLRGARFAGPEEQFGKALRALSVRPKPDTANCVKDAVGAVEGVARILTGNHTALLSDIIKDLRAKKVIHGALAKCFDGAYAYRGDAEGAAHGAVTNVDVPLAEAEMTLNVSASLIIYLVNKHAEGAL
jgi:hypothetical protein